MFRKVIIASGIIFVLMLLVFGWEKSWSYVKGTQQVLNAEADDRAPMKLESARITALIDKENEAVLGHQDKIDDLEARREATARSIAASQKNLAAEMELLRRIKSMLDKKEDKYTIGRNTFTYAEVNADALERLQAVKRMRETVAFNDTLLGDLDSAVKQGRASLGEANKRMDELKNALARLDARNVTADVRLEVAKLISSVAGAPLPADSELERAVRNYDRRVSQKERRAESHLNAGGGQFRIDYSAAVVTQDASSEIGQMLSDVPREMTVPAAPQTRPSAVDSLQIEQD